MWRDAGELYAHAIQVEGWEGKKVQWDIAWAVGLLGER